MCNGLPRTTLSYSGDALRSFTVQPTSQLRRDVRKRLFNHRIWSPLYKHVNKGNSNVKQSFDHSVTVRKYVPGVKLEENTSHMLQRTLLAHPCTLDDLLEFNDTAQACIERWKKIV